MPVQRLKLAIPPLDVLCYGLIAHSGETVVTGQSHTKKPDRLFPKDESVKVLGFKYAIWNVRGLREKEKFPVIN
jgi:hypothetical protein